MQIFKLRFCDFRISDFQFSRIDPPVHLGCRNLVKPSLEKRGVLVVLDDDPTGTQIVHDVTVLTTFEQEVLIEQFRTKEAGFFILTNTRAYHYMR